MLRAPVLVAHLGCVLCLNLRELLLVFFDSLPCFEGKKCGHLHCVHHRPQAIVREGAVVAVAERLAVAGAELAVRVPGRA